MLVIRTSDGEIRWMDVSAYLKERAPEKPVRQIVFEGERFDAVSVQRWRKRMFSRDGSETGNSSEILKDAAPRGSGDRTRGLPHSETSEQMGRQREAIHCDALPLCPGKMHPQIDTLKSVVPSFRYQSSLGIIALLKQCRTIPTCNTGRIAACWKR